MAPVTRKTLGEMLQERAATIVGRDPELASLDRLLADDGPVVAYVEGLAGVGKSTLVRAFAARARGAGATTLELDCHNVHPTQGGAVAAIVEGLQRGGNGGAPSPERACEALAEAGERVVVLFDSYEMMRMADPWLCRTFIPGLPPNVRIVLATRVPPRRFWRETFGDAFQALALANLDPEDAVALLRASGVDAETAPRINQVAHGHPLSLQLAAGALRDRPGIALDALTVGPVGEELAQIYLDGLDPATRRALDAAALTRRTTLSILEAMLPEEPAPEAFERLRRLPFVNLGPDGLVVHDTVREVTAALLRASNPEAYWRLRTAAWRRLRTEVRGAPQRDLGRYTADMIFLIEDEAVREAFFPVVGGEYLVEPAETGDREEAEALAGEWLDEAEADQVGRWWDAVPAGFLAARDEKGRLRGFACLLEHSAVPPRLLDADPLAGGWREHLRRDPPPRGQRTLFLRYLCGGAAGSAAQSALLLDVTRTYMEMRPQLRRVYAPARYLNGADPTCAITMGYLPLDGHPDSVCVDFGPASVDGWLDELGERKLKIESEGGIEPTERRLVLGGKQIELTRLEAEVLAYLQRHEGEAVRREDLLRDVWGYDWDGGSNVIETVVSSLRKKLGDRAAALKTVRGVGYRLEPLG